MKLTYTSTGVTLSIIVLVLTLLISTDLKNPEPTWFSAFGIIFLINIICYFLKRLNKRG